MSGADHVPLQGTSDPLDCRTAFAFFQVRYRQGTNRPITQVSNEGRNAFRERRHESSRARTRPGVNS
jgi:hypothetical protein